MSGKKTKHSNIIDKEHAAFRRLLLAKQLYLHGLEHSNNAGALNKMIAVHNFHNAIEIVLRTIALHFDIRLEKELNITFEQMITDIDKHTPFKDAKIKLPYQSQIKTLNQIRNFVQHHGYEPESSAMDDWRSITRHFLIDSCQQYFEKSFDEISPLDMIEDAILRELLRLSLISIKEEKFGKSLILSKMAFEWAQKAIFSFIPNEKVLTWFSVPSECKIRDLKKILEKIEEKSNTSLYLVGLLSGGIGLVDYRKFQSVTPHVSLAIGGKPYVRWHVKILGGDEAQWTHDFVVNMIMHWQVLGLKPCVPDRCVAAMQKIIDERGAGFD